MKSKLKILSIDGGGIRGVIPCTILKFIESQLGGNLCETFDLIAGTSTGGIITLGLTTQKPNDSYPYYAEEMLDLYKSNGNQIFAKRGKDFLSVLGAIFQGLPEEMTAKPYESENLEILLDKYFKNATLSETKTNALITTYDITEGKPFIFSTRLAKNHDTEQTKENFLIRDIARSTSAAPTYFKPNLLTGKGTEDFAFVDGGVFANNPAILAYAEAKELWKTRSTLAFDAVVTATDDDLPFYMLSIGTGTHRQRFSGQDAQKWRTAKWLQPLLTSVFMQSVAESTHYAMQHLLPAWTDGTPRYQRINIEIPEENTAMDDASAENIDTLCEIAEKYVKENEAQLLKICELLR